MFATSVLRVRALLDTGLAPFKKLLPRGVLSTLPDATTLPYPSMLLSVLPAEGRYAALGIVAEELLRLPPGRISVGSVLSVLSKVVPSTPQADKDRVKASKTTQPFCDALNATATLLHSARDPAAGSFRFDTVVAHENVQGHPDIRTATQIFEVKLTGRLKEGWPYFLCQVFAYAAIDPSVKEVALVLPLQKTVWRYALEDPKSWPRRAEYLALLKQTARDLSGAAALPAAPPIDLSGAIFGLFGAGGGVLDLSGVGLAALLGGLAPAAPSRAQQIQDECLIGSHIRKLPKLADTFRSAPDPARPWQIFLGGPQTSKFKVADEDIAAGSAILAETRTRFFVHSQYIINLAKAAEGGDTWHTDCLRRNLEVAVASGCRGVVVHVGKSVGQEKSVAIEQMRANIAACLSAATPECPLLLETPAGQGTELLTDPDEFIGFVTSFNDSRLRICVDTCHVFACGHDPLTYIKKVQEADPALLHLIHYNDSAEPCGCRKDRHAHMGTGHIGMEKMETIARHCHSATLPMVIE
jgi:deoxyribonuclease-4